MVSCTSLKRADNWPAEAQKDLAEVAGEIEAELRSDAYRATPEELAGIYRGLRDSADGKFATDEEVEAVFAKHRRS
jgi:predicted transcriptional regulator